MLKRILYEISMLQFVLQTNNIVLSRNKSFHEKSVRALETMWNGKDSTGCFTEKL